jgi:ATP-dependent DNA ligase
VNSYDVITLLDEIAATSSRNAKEDLLRKHIDDPLVQRVVRLAYDPFITFGITPPQVKTFGKAVFTTDTPEVWSLLDRLAKRSLTGNAAKEEVEQMLTWLDPFASKLLWLILRKDLRCGISEKTINLVLPNTVPTFDLMLSKAYEEKRIKVFPVAVEPKLDGFRGMSLISGGVSKAFSRVGNHFPQLDWAGPFLAQMVDNARARVQNAESCPGMSEKVRRFIWDLLGGDAGPSAAIDGEAVSGSYKTTSGDLRRKGEEATDTILHVFDIVPYAFMRDTGQIEWKVPLKVRRRVLAFVVGCAPEGAPVQLTDLREANSHEKIQAIYAEHRANGLEGAMVKPWDGHYVKKKGFLWLKMKAEETADLRVTGWFEGKVGTKLEGKFGGFIVDHNGVEVRVGGGFSDAQREQFEADCRHDDALAEANAILEAVPGRALGRLCEVEYHEVTPDGSLRHPRFVRWRDDKDEALRVAA